MVNQCPNCDEVDLVVQMGNEATCGVCHTTFEMFIAPIPCGCTESGICNECMIPAMQKYERDADEIAIPAEFLRLYHKDQSMQEVETQTDKF